MRRRDFLGKTAKTAMVAGAAYSLVGVDKIWGTGTFNAPSAYDLG